MNHILVTFMSELTQLSPEEAQSIEESFPIKKFEKGSYLLKEGQYAKDAYFVQEGCIRNYQIIDGEERTLDIYTENQSAADFNSMVNESPSTLNFICVEETIVAVINTLKEQALYKKHPRFETFCREGMEKMMGTQQENYFKFMKMTPEEKYLNLLDERPNLINRVPQYQLASYLGMKPETLSRIRKRILVKKS